jgi:hypothetical protein
MPYKEVEACTPNFIEPPPEVIEGEQEWEVEKVLEDQLYQKLWQYLVWWKGYSPVYNSWVKHSNLYVPDLVTKYVTSRHSKDKN